MQMTVFESLSAKRLNSLGQVKSSFTQWLCVHRPICRYTYTISYEALKHTLDLMLVDLLKLKALRQIYTFNVLASANDWLETTIIYSTGFNC